MMREVDVEVLLKPINNGKNTLPIVRADDQVFVYGNNGLYTCPAKSLESSSTDSWIKLGTALVATGITVATEAYRVYMTKFKTFEAVKANPVGFAIELIITLFGVLENKKIWKELTEQDWENVVVDAKGLFKKSSASMNNSGHSMRTSFNSRSSNIHEGRTYY